MASEKPEAMKGTERLWGSASDEGLFECVLTGGIRQEKALGIDADKLNARGSGEVRLR